MATASITGGILSLELRPWDVVMAVHGSLNIPLEHITGATSGPAPPIPWFIPFKLIGASIPGVKAAGTFYSPDHGIVFYDYGAGRDCLILELQHETYKQVVIEIDPPQTAAAAAAQVTEALAKR